MKINTLNYVGFFSFLLSGVLIFPVHAVEEVSRAMNAAGGKGASAQYVNTSVTGLGMPIGFISSASFINHSGFLHPTNDLSTSVQDSDGDDLTDWQEVSGSAFEPTTPTGINASDSDGDGFSDGDEALAGTNPLDAANLLYLTRFWREGGYQLVSWQGREGHSYQVLRAPTIFDLQTNAVVMAEMTGGAGMGAWQTVECNASNTAPDDVAFYQVRLKPIE
ncbi:MAG: thrombospondin type 3 repeat-containing protein [Kiritimatiellae bacterium]|nr:thrombospondin type 3 repeat-containing protein [Kiritimatiellia bacterium]